MLDVKSLMLGSLISVLKVYGLGIKGLRDVGNTHSILLDQAISIFACINSKCKRKDATGTNRSSRFYYTERQKILDK
jgi:hypothetical protein